MHYNHDNTNGEKPSLRDLFQIVLIEKILRDQILPYPLIFIHLQFIDIKAFYDFVLIELYIIKYIYNYNHLSIKAL